MQQFEAQIFNKALQSNNLQVVARIAQIFNELGQHQCANVLMTKVYSTEYAFGGMRIREEFLQHNMTPRIGFGVDYSQVQKRLNDLGIAKPPLEVDGKWGAKSKTALIAYQKAKGLAADGIPGPITLGALGISSASNTASSTMGSVTPAAANADAKAYAIAKNAAPRLGMTEKEIQYVVSVARGEGYYGNGWGNPSAKTLEMSKKFGLTGYEGIGSNNWGAVQGTGSAGSFKHIDYNAKGEPYVGNYKKYLTPEEGFLDMAKTILGGGPIRKEVGSKEIKAAIAEGNLRKAVYAQHANKYFELNPEQYLSAVLSNYSKIMSGIQWPRVLAENGITATKAGIGLTVALSTLALFLLNKRIGFIHT